MVPLESCGDVSGCGSDMRCVNPFVESLRFATYNAVKYFFVFNIGCAIVDAIFLPPKVFR
jgi:hypothetical protein